MESHGSYHVESKQNAINKFLSVRLESTGAGAWLDADHCTLRDGADCIRLDAKCTYRKNINMHGISFLSYQK